MKRKREMIVSHRRKKGTCYLVSDHSDVIVSEPLISIIGIRTHSAFGILNYGEATVQDAVTDLSRRKTSMSKC